jgi:TIR domain
MSKDDEMNPPVYKSPAKEWDLFISYAGEDREYVRETTEWLRSHGLTIFLDERDLTAGRSLRGQIDSAITNSYLGLLFVSPSFIKKRWPIQEFDAFFTLESDGTSRIIPVLLGITHEELTSVLPILASRLAIKADEDTEKLAKEILRNVEKIFNENGSWAQLVRMDTLCLPWISRPLFFRKSLKMLDDYFPTFWLPQRLVSDIPGHENMKTLLVGDVIEGGILYDGLLVAVTGRQTLVQLYERHSDQFDEYVCQLNTNHHAHRKSILYVRYVVPTRDIVKPNESEIEKVMPFNVPRAPEGYLTTVIGYIIATGGMQLADDSSGNAAYMVAVQIIHAPQLVNTS